MSDLQWIKHKQRDWSRAMIVRPKDYFTTPGHFTKKFIPSYERDNCPESMALLLGWEYARLWAKERDQFLKKRKKAVQSKVIKNDFQWWIKKRSSTEPLKCVQH